MRGLAIERYVRERRRLLGVLLVVAVANAGSYFLLTRRFQDEARMALPRIASVRQEEQRVGEEFGRAVLEVNSLEKAVRQMDTLKTDILQLNGERFSRVDLKIKELQREFGWTAHSVTFSYDPLKKEGLTKFMVSFRMKGGYDRLRDFVAAVEGATDDDDRDLFLTLESVRLADSTDGGRDLNLTVDLSTYFRQPELEVAPEPKRRADQPRTPGASRTRRTQGGA